MRYHQLTPEQERYYDDWELLNAAGGAGVRVLRAIQPSEEELPGVIPGLTLGVIVSGEPNGALHHTYIFNWFDVLDYYWDDPDGCPYTPEQVAEALGWPVSRLFFTWSGQ